MALTGRAMVLLALGIVPVLLVPQWVTLVPWLALWAGLLGVDAARPAPVSDVRLRRPTIPALRHAQEAVSQLQVLNTAPRVLRAVVRDAWQPSAGAGVTRHRLVVPPGELRRVSTGLRPWRRGDIRAAGVTVRSFGPLGLLARQRTAPVPGLAGVRPELSSRRHLPSRS